MHRQFWVALLGRLAGAYTLVTANAAAKVATLLAHSQPNNCSGLPGSPTLSTAVHDPHFLPGLTEALPRSGLPDHAAVVHFTLPAKSQTGRLHKLSSRSVTLHLR